MRVAKLKMRIAMLAGLVLAASSCQTAKKPAPLLSAKTAPALTTAAKAPPPPPPSRQAQPSPPPAAPAKQAQAPAETATDAKTQSAPPAPETDAVDDLLALVEKQYQAGLDAFHSGHNDIAKQDFDSAINTLLGSNLDIRSDDRLEKEFERIVEGIDHLDLGGLASDSDAQKSEPAPIDESNGLTPSADPKLKAKAQAEIKSTHSDLPLMMTDQVAGFISHFSTS